MCLGFWYVWGEGIVCVRVGILDLGGNFRLDGGCMQAEAEWFVRGGVLYGNGGGNVDWLLCSV